MAKLIIKDDNNPDDVQKIEVSSYAEATWFLVKDLIYTADTLWSVQILDEWLRHPADVKEPDRTRVAVTKENGAGTDTFTFIYDPS